MHLLAVTALEAMRGLPKDTWLKIGLVVVGIIVIFVVVPKVLKMNKLIMGVIIFVASTIIFFSWVSQRNEPAFLTPVIDQLAPYFSSDVRRVKEPEKKPVKH